MTNKVLYLLYTTLHRMIWQFVQQVTKLPDVFFVTKYKKTEDKGLNYFATLLSGLKAGERECLLKRVQGSMGKTASIAFNRRISIPCAIITLDS